MTRKRIVNGADHQLLKKNTCTWESIYIYKKIEYIHTYSAGSCFADK